MSEKWNILREGQEFIPVGDITADFVWLYIEHEYNGKIKPFIEMAAPCETKGQVKEFTFVDIVGEGGFGGIDVKDVKAWMPIVRPLGLDGKEVFPIEEPEDWEHD